MHLTLLATRGLPGQPETTMSVSGDVLTCNGVAYDLSPVPEGGRAMAPECGSHPFVGPITRVDGQIHATVQVALGDDADLHQPVDGWEIANVSGPVTIPKRLRSEDAA